MTSESDEAAIGRSALAKASWRLLPLIGLGYGIAYMDRVNLSFAHDQMKAALGFSETVYGLGGGLFFLAYAAGEVPSNLMLARFGARRWIARIMITWGVIAMGMMFVSTPTQFYVMRFLLGAAEAGFFPGVVYYLMHWFPAQDRGRAISRFYVALPLSGVVMGLVAGPLLGLNGLGLGGWQWLFLAQGAPAVLLSVAVWFLLPDRPADARWLSDAEKGWIARRLEADRAEVGSSGDPGIGRALVDGRVWLLGAANVLILGSAYAFNLSAPTMLKAFTGLGDTRVGWLVAAVSLAAALGMVTAGWHSDLRRERHWHTAGLLAAMSGGFLAVVLAPGAVTVLVCYTIYTIAGSALQTVFWLIPSDVLHGRSAAVGVAAIGSIGMVGAFVGPWAWGAAKDATGTWRLGEGALFVAYAVAAVIILLLRRRQRAAPAGGAQAVI